jgi:diguanylate cyclase (GGDEF)-like protein
MTGEAGTDALLASVDDHLRTPRRGLVFVPEIERLYTRRSDPRQIRLLLRITLAGLVLFNLFLFTDHEMIPDVFTQTVFLQLCIITPICLVLVAAIKRRNVLAQPILTIILSIIALHTMAMFLWSRAPGALLLPFVLPLLQTCCLTIPLRFRLSALFAVVSTTLITVAILCHPGYDFVTRCFTLLLLVSMGGHALVASYYIESSARVSYLLKLRETLRSKALASSNLALQSLSTTDGLTGIGNRRCFDDALKVGWREATALRQPLGLLLVDIDHFKKINDYFGHQTGDRCLLLVADIIRQHTRDSHDLAARFGGEEFVILLADATLDAVQQVAERLRCAIEEMMIPLDGPAQAGAVKISVGCASLTPAPGDGQGALIEEADRALYCAKRGGRNRIHPPLPDAELNGVAAKATTFAARAVNLAGLPA